MAFNWKYFITVLVTVFSFVSTNVLAAEKVDYFYDDLGRLERATYTDENGYVAKVVDYSYYETGNIVQKAVGLPVITPSSSAYDFGFVYLWK